MVGLSKLGASSHSSVVSTAWPQFIPVLRCQRGARLNPPMSVLGQRTHRGASCFS